MFEIQQNQDQFEDKIDVLSQEEENKNSDEEPASFEKQPEEEDQEAVEITNKDDKQAAFDPFGTMM